MRKTFRQLLKEELEKRNIPVGRYKEYLSYKGYYNEYAIKEGVKIERSVYNMYKACTGKQDKIEEILVYTNGYADKKEIEKIAEKLKENYDAKSYNYLIKQTDVYVW